MRMPTDSGTVLPRVAGLLSKSLVLLILVAAFGHAVDSGSPRFTYAAGPSCVTSGPSSGAYSVSVCISTAGGSTLSGNVGVTNTVTTVTGSAPAVSQINSRIATGTVSPAYPAVLADYSPPYAFTLPTDRWTDGIYRLRADVTLADGFQPTPPVLQVTFSNGVTVAPSSSGSWSPYAAGGGSVTLAAVGDGAGGMPGATTVGTMVTGWNPDMFVYLGDVYNCRNIHRVPQLLRWHARGPEVPNQPCRRQS